MPENAAREIVEIKNIFVSVLAPEKIYLFGSFAEGTQTEDSDFDFYIVVKDTSKNLVDLTAEAYKSIRHVKSRPVDIIVGAEQSFAKKKDMYTVENEVASKGVLLYDR